MDWLNKLKEYAPDIVTAVLTGGATLPQLALKAVADATGNEVNTQDDLQRAVESATPEMMLKITQANNQFKVRMRELDNDLVTTELGEVTARWKSDNEHSVTRLVRPLSYISVLVVFFIITFADGNLGDFAINEKYIPVFETLLSIMTIAYFGSRGAEKVTKMFKSASKNRN